jgi:transcriptional regulator with XRE-family HTH domain
MTEIYRRVGANVAKNRKAKGFSQLDLALAMGHKSVSVVSLPEIVHNGKHFNIEHLCKIAEILGVSVNEFFDGVESARDEQPKQS